MLLYSGIHFACRVADGTTTLRRVAEERRQIPWRIYLLCDFNVRIQMDLNACCELHLMD